jgi:hypothetical protein
LTDWYLRIAPRIGAAAELDQPPISAVTTAENAAPQLLLLLLRLLLTRHSALRHRSMTGAT